MNRHVSPNDGTGADVRQTTIDGFVQAKNIVTANQRRLPDGLRLGAEDKLLMTVSGQADIPVGLNGRRVTPVCRNRQGLGPTKNNPSIRN